MLKVLIVEDEPEKREILISFFKKNGIYGPSVKECEDVSSALTLLRNTKYDVICLDLNLPLRTNELAKEDGGLTILNKLSSPQYRKPIYIFGLTNYSNIMVKQLEFFKKYDFNLYSYSEDIWQGVLRNKIEWIRDLKKQESDSDNRSEDRDINILVHGVMTCGSWQEELTQLINPDKMKSIPYKYSYYSALKIINSFSRKNQVNQFLRFIEKIFIENPNSNINIIGHSFGTYLIVKSLEKLHLDNLTRVNYIILSGSVVRSDYNFNDLIYKYSIKKVINDCGVNDIPLIFSKVFCFGLGHGGRVGFDSCSNQLLNRYHKAGHSLYVSSPDFVAKYWASVLNDGVINDGESNIDYGINKYINPVIGVVNPYIVVSLLLISFIFFSY